MVSETAEQPGLALTIAKDGDHLAWQAANVSSGDVWVFLLIPATVKGRPVLDPDGAWIDVAEDGTVIVRKVDTPVPPGRIVDAIVQAGAVRMKAGETRQGRVQLGAEVNLRAPYDGVGRSVPVQRVVLEVGWVPFREDAQPEMLEWQGQPFAYVFTPAEPGGQRFSRSQPLAWR